MAMWNMFTIYLFINLRKHMLRYDSVHFKFATSSLGKAKCVLVVGYCSMCLVISEVTHTVKVRVEVLTVVQVDSHMLLPLHCLTRFLPCIGDI